jgi:hypothetical protein
MRGGQRDAWGSFAAGALTGAALVGLRCERGRGPSACGCTHEQGETAAKQRALRRAWPDAAVRRRASAQQKGWVAGIHGPLQSGTAPRAALALPLPSRPHLLPPPPRPLPQLAGTTCCWAQSRGPPHAARCMSPRTGCSRAPSCAPCSCRKACWTILRPCGPGPTTAGRGESGEPRKSGRRRQRRLQRRGLRQSGSNRRSSWMFSSRGALPPRRRRQRQQRQKRSQRAARRRAGGGGSARWCPSMTPARRALSLRTCRGAARWGGVCQSEAALVSPLLAGAGRARRAAAAARAARPRGGAACRLSPRASHLLPELLVAPALRRSS